MRLSCVPTFLMYTAWHSWPRSAKRFMTAIDWRSAPPWVNEAVTKITFAMTRSKPVLGTADSREPTAAYAEQRRHRGIGSRQERAANDEADERSARDEIAA